MHMEHLLMKMAIFSLSYVIVLEIFIRQTLVKTIINCTKNNKNFTLVLGATMTIVRDWFNSSIKYLGGWR